MDNVTHTLFALTLARTRLGRGVRGATVALVLASNAPDIDIVATAGGAATYLKWHRAITHGPLGVVGLGLLAAAIVWAALRARGPQDADAERDRTSFVRLAGISIAGVLLHVLMDLPTSYGTRLLTPFDWHWFTTDWMPIVDLYLLVALLAGLYFGARSEAARRWNATLVLALMMGNYGIRAAAHERALSLVPRLFGPTLPARCEGATLRGLVVERWPHATSPKLPMPGEVRCLLEIAATPTFISPFDWRIIAHTSSGYELYDVNVLSPRFLRPVHEPEVLWRLGTHYPNQWTPDVMVAAATRSGQTFLGFSRFPAARTFGPPSRFTGGTDGVRTVQLTDVRFLIDIPRQLRVTTGRARGAPPFGTAPPSPFTLTVQFSPAGGIVEERLGP